jgi:tripartite-type tricarboxylate transporter receptor subunit TctC
MAKESFMTRTKAALAALAACATLAWAAFAVPAAAQDWPTRPITLIVPFAAGGGVDASARLQALAIGEILGQTVVVENVGAAAGTVGSARVAKAAPDGYTMLIGNSGTHAYSQSLYKRKPYDTLTDFEPVSIVTESPRILIARKGLPVNNLQELVAYMKANQAKMQYSSAGVGSGTHLPCALLNHTLGVNITMVPYRGEGPALQDVVGDRMDYMCTTIQSGAVQARDGTVKGIAVMAARRDHPQPRHHRRAGPARRRGNGVERLLLPQGHAEADRRQDAQGDRADDQQARHQAEDGGAGPRNPAARTAHAGLYGKVSQGRHRALGRGDQGRRHQRGLMGHRRAKRRRPSDGYAQRRRKIVTCVSP